MKKEYTLVLDVGTSGIKAFVFDGNFRIIQKAYASINRDVRGGGTIVEQDPVGVFETSCDVIKRVYREARIPEDKYIGFGITNQRETVVSWNKNSGIPNYPAIVWQDTRTKDECDNLFAEHGAFVRKCTGLPLDPYFSASKIHWLLQNGYISRDSIIGTLDSWLLWNITENNLHLTDSTNASRTLLWDINTKEWRKELLGVWGIEKRILPDVRNSRDDFGVLSKKVFGFSMPIVALCGDQQSSWYAAHALRGGETKVTFGTGIFMMQKIADMNIFHNSFVTVVPSAKGGIVYALEEKIESFCAEKVTPHLGNLVALRPIMESFARVTADAVTRLPQRPSAIVMDGGVTQSDDLIYFLEKYIRDIPVIRQSPYDGTALGIAALINQKD